MSAITTDPTLPCNNNKKKIDMAAPESQAEKIKAHGNECFAKGKLDAAIEAYSECICLEPGIAVYYTNRALCYHKKGQWDAVVRDCQVVLSIDAQSVKAHYMLGQALIEQGQLQRGEQGLQRALQLCKERTVSYKEDILRALLSARKRIWESTCAESAAAIDASEALVGQLVATRGSSEDSGGLPPASVGALQEAIAMLRRRHTPRAVPDHFCCKISMEVMLEPVTTPCGISYEKACLRDHLARLRSKGEPGFDPISRKPLQSIEQAVPNLALKEAIGEFLQEHPWAYECTL